jgi:phytoene dehydrogenase-like protein
VLTRVANARTSDVDAIVVGAGPNGLVAANLLADAGWDVLIVEAADHPGGAVHSDESVQASFITDQFSSFYPLAAASPVLNALQLSDYGLTWTHAPTVLAHVWPDDRSAVISRDRQRSAASIDSFAAGDGSAWLSLVEQFERISEPLLDSLFSPFPPVRAGARLARRMGLADLLRFARFGVTSVRRFGEEEFRGEGGPLLIAGNALHTDLGPDAAGSAVYGWLLALLAQTVGFPVPIGGSGQLTRALVDRFTARGGQVRLNREVTSIDIAGGKETGTASGVRLRDGERITARRAVVADVSAPALYRDLVGLHRLPGRLATDLGRFQWDAATFKVNWALSSPIPWTATEPRDAGTVHLGVDLNGLTSYAASLARRDVPAEPFLLLGQTTTADPSRSPTGTESAWAYTHLPPGLRLSSADVRRQTELIEEVVERNAPGFRDRVIARSVQAPVDLETADANLRGGAVTGGTAAIHQQLMFRPIPGLGRAETPIDRLYLASASAHPGGGVHGGPGANAARAALLRDRLVGRLGRPAVNTAFRWIYRD